MPFFSILLQMLLLMLIILVAIKEGYRWGWADGYIVGDGKF